MHQTRSSSAGAPWAYFTVPGIPGALGFEASSTSMGGRNVAFVSGPYYYVVGAGWSSAGSEVSRAAVISAALRLYHRAQAL